MSKRSFRVEYASGVAEAERTLEQKAITYPGLEAGRQDGDNFRRNTITTLERYEDTGAATRHAAVGLSATWACVNLLAGTIASLPLMVYRTDAAGVRSVARDHPLYWLLHDSPNYDQSAVDFWEFMCASLELQGNAYALIEKRADGFIVSLTPVRPDLMTVRRLGNGDIEYTWEDGGPHRETQSNVLHIRGFSGSPLGGVSPLGTCRSAFASAMAVERASSTVFANGIRPTGVLSSDKPLTKEQMDEAQARLEEKYAGAMNAGRPLLLNNGLTWTQLTIDPQDAQMLESRRFSVEEICRVFGVPPHMIGHTENSTSWGTGLEQQTLGFQKFTLRRRLKRIEQALEKQLLSRTDRNAGITIEFNLEGLLRADSTARASFYKSGLGDGWMTINEVRRLENMPPVDGGDTPRMQSQNVPISGAGSVSQSEENPV